MKKIIIDLNGSDNGPEELLKGVLLAAEKHPETGFVLSTTEKDADVNMPNIEILAADDVIGCDEPAMCIFKARDTSSMALALAECKNNDDALGLLCAGNTGALMVGSIFRLGLQSGLKSPALSTLLPHIKGGMCTLVDCGANVNIEPANLVDFARLGSDFMHRMFDIEKPTVALLNVGREEGKGTPIYVQAHALLKEASERGEINFIGNAEGYDIIAGYADVIVCDGFAGNIVLKLTEAVGKTAISLVSQYAPGNPCSDKLSELFVLNERGGATFLGTKKPVIKMHGCANAETVVACVDQLLQLCR